MTRGAYEPPRTIVAPWLQITATNRRGVAQVARRVGPRDRIVAYLQRIAPMEASPKVIASEVCLNHNTVKSEMARMLAKSSAPIVRTSRGLYRARLNRDAVRIHPGVKRLGLHGLKIEGRCTQGSTGYCLLGPPTNEGRKRKTYQRLFRGRLVTITVHDGGLVEVFVKTDESPIYFDEFDCFVAWMEGLLEWVDQKSWQLRQYGVCADILGMRLDGIRSLRLSAFRNAWFQVYQKGDDLVRFETHAVTDITLTEVLTVIKQMAESATASRYSPSECDPDDFSVR